MERDRIEISLAQPPEMEEVLAMVEKLLVELGDEGEEFARIDKERLRIALDQEHQRGTGGGSDQAAGAKRFLAFVARDGQGTLQGVLTLSTTFALYAGGECGVIEEMYVRPSARGRGIGTRLLGCALAVAHERRWSRLEVTGPAAWAVWAVAGAAGGGAAGAADRGESTHGAGQDRSNNVAQAVRAVHFYEKLGFEHVGPKLRLLLESRPPAPANSGSSIVKADCREGGRAS